MTSPIQYMKEFNSYVNLYQKQRTLEVENLLNRNLTLLSGVQNLQVFRPDNLECSQFYISLYEIMKRVDFKTGSDLGIACLTVLQRATRNLDARNDLLNQFRFVPLLAKLMEDASSKDILLRLLEVTQDLSYGIQITWEEPYLSGLMKKLIELIHGEETSLGSLALSVLINICYKNVPSIYLLLRITHVSTFTKKIRPYGVLAYKLLIIIDNYVDVPGVADIRNFIKKSLSDITECFRTYNLPYLKHIVEFLTDTQNNQSMEMTFRETNDFHADIDKLLQEIDSQNFNIGPFETRSDNEQCLAQCFSLLFILLESFLKADPTMSNAIPRMFDIALKWVETEQASAKSLDLMRTIISIDSDEHNNKFLKIFELLIPKMLNKIEANELHNDQIIALFKVMISILRNSKMQAVVLSTFTESYFNKMLSSLINTNPESLNYAKFSCDELAKYLLCLQILIEFSNIAPKVWQSKVIELFKKKQIHYVIAKGILCENENLCQVVFEIAKTPDFPRDDVAKITTKLSPLITVNNSKANSSNRLFHDVRVTEKLWINDSVEERLDDLITHIFEAMNRSEFNNVAISELIELFHYKINLCQNTEKNLIKRLGDANEEITNLSHRINLLAHEMSQYYSMNFKLHLTQERLQAENKDYIQQRDKLKESSNELLRKIDADRKKYQSYMTSLEAKKTEAEILRKELESYKEKDAIKNAELKKYETEKRETTTRMDQLKKNIHKLEEAITEKQTLLKSSEQENQKSVKTIEDLRESNKKSDDLIKHLEKQLAAKNEKIRLYEAELNETEEMRKTILSLMESKRPKRAS